MPPHTPPHSPLSWPEGITGLQINTPIKYHNNRANVHHFLPPAVHIHMLDRGARNAPGLCLGQLQSQPDTSPGWGPILPQPQDISSENRWAVSCSMVLSWSCPESLPKNVPHTLCPGHQEDCAPALCHLCHGKALEMAAWHEESVCGHKHIYTDRNEMGERLLSPLCTGRGSRERVSNAQHCR